MLSLGVVIIASYILGSIPTSIVVSRLKNGIDVRDYGSGNAGGTNVIRVLGWKTGVFVILVDVLKGLVATVVVSRFFYDRLPFSNYTPFDDFTLVQIICGCAAVVGHAFTLFAGFRGGKGVATAAGMLLGLAPIEFLVAIGVFVVTFIVSRYVSVGSISGAISAPLTMFFRENIFRVDIEGYNTLIYFILGVSAFLVYTHRSNIKRLLHGTENRIARVALTGKKKPPPFGASQ
ncbi:MAG: glycerol-3-phosphate 1-O-acyltransferase PlsY [Bacteroidota bacterium]